MPTIVNYIETAMKLFPAIVAAELAAEMFDATVYGVVAFVWVGYLVFKIIPKLEQE